MLHLFIPIFIFHVFLSIQFYYLIIFSTFITYNFMTFNTDFIFIFIAN